MASARERKPSIGTEDDEAVRKDRANSVSRVVKTTVNAQAAKAPSTVPSAQQRKNLTPGVLPPPAPKKAKSQPATTATVTAPAEENQAVINARYWRTRCKLLDQRAKFKIERDDLLAKLEAVTRTREETKKRTMMYKNSEDISTNICKALSLLELQMPALDRLNEVESELKTKLEHFTTAIEQLLGSVLTVDMEVVNIPKTDSEKGKLATQITELNTDLAQLTLSLGSRDDAGQIVTAVGYMLTALELLLKAIDHFEKNKDLMEKAEVLKQKEDVLKNYMRQLDRFKELLR